MRTDFTFLSAVKQWTSRVQKYAHVNRTGPSEPENLHAQIRWLASKGRLLCREKARRGSGRIFQVFEERVVVAVRPTGICDPVLNISLIQVNSSGFLALSSPTSN